MDRWGGYTYYWSGSPHAHLEGRAVAVADRLVSMVTEVTFVMYLIMSVLFPWYLCKLRMK